MGNKEFANIIENPSTAPQETAIQIVKTIFTAVKRKQGLARGWDQDRDLHPLCSNCSLIESATGDYLLPKRHLLTCIMISPLPWVYSHQHLQCHLLYTLPNIYFFTKFSLTKINFKYFLVIVCILNTFYKTPCTTLT